MAKATNKSKPLIRVEEVHLQEAKFNILFVTPPIINRFSLKARQELLYPSIRENRAGLEQSLKHDPVTEFRGSVYKNRDEKSAAALHIPNGAFHKALAAAALDVPGAAKKTQIERLTSVEGVNIDLFGVPNLYMAMVRNSDIRHTPDVRTRAIFPEAACTVKFNYAQNRLVVESLVNLMGWAGQFVGIGDWRPQKGGPHGKFRLVEDDNADFKRIVKTQGRKAQLNALERPICYDEESSELLAWFEQEVKNRAMQGQLGGKGKRRKNGPLPDMPIIQERGDGEYVGVE